MSHPTAPARDQDATPFSEILTTLCETAGARCAALVDGEGETVDYGGRGEPFDIRILAAEWRLILHRLSEAQILCSSFEFVVRARHKSFLVESLPEGYALVVELPKRSTGLSERAMSRARRGIIAEAGFPKEVDPRGAWSHVAVEEEPGHSRRPSRVMREEKPQEVTVIGTIPTPEVPKEKSYRVRLSSGQECTLVRERLGHWYVEE